MEGRNIMGRGNSHMECPFGECTEICCHFKNNHTGALVQCPTKIFNKCHEDSPLDENDAVLIRQTWQDVLFKRQGTVGNPAGQ
jgi:hypothetical protein